jgi:hypothetical protein
MPIYLMCSATGLIDRGDRAIDRVAAPFSDACSSTS